MEVNTAGFWLGRGGGKCLKYVEVTQLWSSVLACIKIYLYHIIIVKSLKMKQNNYR